MERSELKNALVELNLQGIITDKELITFYKRLKTKFINSSPHETEAIIPHEKVKRVCVHNWQLIHAEAYKCTKCGIIDIDC